MTVNDGYVYGVWVDGQDVTGSLADNVYTWTLSAEEWSNDRPEIVFGSEHGGEPQPAPNSDELVLSVDTDFTKNNTT